MTEKTREIEVTEEEEEEGEGDSEDLKCPECESTNLKQVDKRGEKVCDDCGLVVEEDMIDRGKEWRSFSYQEEEERSRTGSPTTNTMHDKGLTTDISKMNKDAKGRVLSASKREQMNRIRERHRRARTADSKEKNLQFALSEIDRICGALNLPESTKQIASAIYRQALDKDLIRGRSIEGVVGASVYAACRKSKNARTITEIEKPSRVGEKEIGRTFRYLSQELGLELEPTPPEQFLPRFCSELGIRGDMKQKVIQRAEDIIEISKQHGLLSGKSPSAFAAAAIYIAAKINNISITQKECSEVAGVTEVTIRNRYQEQWEVLEEEG